MADAPSRNHATLLEADEYFNANLDRVLAGEDVATPEHLWSPSVELVNFEPSPFPGTYHGHEGLLKWTRDIFGEFTDPGTEMLEMVEEGDLVAVRMKLFGKGKGSGLEGELVWGAIFEMRDGQIIKVTSDPTYEQTLERFRELTATGDSE